MEVMRGCNDIMTKGHYAYYIKFKIALTEAHFSHSLYVLNSLSN